MPSESSIVTIAPQVTHKLEALGRVQRRYVYPSQECTIRRRAFRGLGILKRSNQFLPHSATTRHLADSLPYRTVFSGQTIEAIVGASAADSTRLSLTLNNQTQSSPQPESQPSFNSNRYSRPTAFSLIPDLRIAPDDEKRTSSDWTSSTTRASSDLQVSSHMLSEKLKSSQAEREGVSFIMASLRQTLGVSK